MIVRTLQTQVPLKRRSTKAKTNLRRYKRIVQMDYPHMISCVYMQRERELEPHVQLYTLHAQLQLILIATKADLRFIIK